MDSNICYASRVERVPFGNSYPDLPIVLSSLYPAIMTNIAVYVPYPRSLV
jgi:hypothetical protein